MDINIITRFFIFNILFKSWYFLYKPTSSGFGMTTVSLKQEKKKINFIQLVV